MSTSVPPRDGESRMSGSPSSLSPGVLADEQALKRVFDAEFDACMTSARSHLGDAASLAPGVVEGAFVNAWNERASFTTPTQLSSFLAAQVQHGAARALSRRASGHRFGALGAEHGASAHTVAARNDPAAVWQAIQSTLHPETHADPRVTRAADLGHEAATHMKSVAPKRRSWMVPAVIAVAAIAALLAGMRYMDRLGEDDAILSEVDSPTLQPLASSGPGQIGTITLGDGTTARIAPETKLFVPDGFPSKIRALRLEGAASFQVAPGEKLPFHVVAKKMHVIATGTQFVVSAYPSDSGIGVQVREGSVTVKTGAATSAVSANQAVHAAAGVVRPATDDERLASFGWVDGQIGLQHSQLRNVVDALTRWFNFNVKVPDLPLLDRSASFSVPLDSSRLAIVQVEKSAGVHFTYEGETPVFVDAKKK